jgi:hypothetical protein
VVTVLDLTATGEVFFYYDGVVQTGNFATA